MEGLLVAPGLEIACVHDTLHNLALASNEVFEVQIGGFEPVAELKGKSGLLTSRSRSDDVYVDQ